MSLTSINFLHLTDYEIQPGQTFSRRPPIRTPWVKTIPPPPPKKKKKKTTPVVLREEVKVKQYFNQI